MALDGDIAGQLDLGKIQRLLDEAEIRRLLLDYCHAIDRCDEEQLASVYHSDATDEHGDVGDGSVAEYVPNVMAYVKRNFQRTTHSLGTILIDINGDVAHTDSYVLSTHLRHPDEDAVTILEQIGGRYIDRLDRRDGVWKFSRRASLVEWSQRFVYDPVYADGVYDIGRRDRSDRGYLRD